MIAAPEICLTTETDPGWSAATKRVETYLRAHGLADDQRIAELAADIVGMARARTRPGVEPMTQAMETLDACLSAWLARLLPEAAGRNDPGLTRGRTALAMSNGPKRWPENFLREGALPPAFVEVMRGAELQPGPELRFRHMAPTAPVVASSGANWRAAVRWPFFRLVGTLLMAISALGAAWAARL